MSGRWWRAYGRARHDPKLLKLTDKQFRWWFSFVCVASDNGGVLPSYHDLAVEFRVSAKTVADALGALAAAGLFDHDETGIRPHNWNGLQYVSDSSSNRVKQFRERQRNVSVTPSETEAETEQKREGAQALPRTGSRLPEDWMPSAEDRAFAEQNGKNPHAIAPSFRDYWHGVAGAKGRKADWSATWRNWVRRETASTKPTASKFPAKPDPQALPPTDPWEQRLQGWNTRKQWLANLWGPPPGESGCRVPKHMITTGGTA